MRFDKLVPMLIKNLLKWLPIFLQSNATRFSPVISPYSVSLFMCLVLLSGGRDCISKVVKLI